MNSLNPTFAGSCRNTTMKSNAMTTFGSPWSPARESVLSALARTSSIGRASVKPIMQRAHWDKLAGETKSLIERWHFPKPVIARVNGFALGGGLEQALACDIIVAADHAEFGLPEPRRGLIAGSAGVHRLPRQIGLKVAMGYMLTGRHMSAARAYELGLVNQVVPLVELDAAVEGWVTDILRCAPLAVRATKEAAMKGLDYPLAQAYYTLHDGERKRRLSDDALEGPRAFAEKRAPDWRGK